MLLKQTLLYLPAQVIGPLLQFVSIILWTHYLPPEEMGVFALLAATQELAYTATLFWFSIYTIRYFDDSADHTSRQQFLDTELTVMTGAGIASALIIGVLPILVSANWSPTLLLAAVTYSAGRTIATHLADRARSAADMTSYSILQITWPVLGLVIGLILVELVAPTTASVIGGYAIAQILAIVAVLPKLDFGKVFGWARQSVKAALRYSVPLVIGLLLVWLANNGIRFLVEQQQGAAAVGMLTIGWALGLRVASFAAMLVTAAAFPLAVNRAREQGMVEGQKQLVENGVLLLAILLPASVGLWLVSRPLMELIVAPAYQEMTALILPWAILAGTTRNFRIHFGEQVFLLHEQSTVPLINDAIDAVLTLIGAFVGLMLGGLVGSVIGAAAGGSISLVITLVWAMSEHRFTLPWQDLMKIGLSVAVMFLVLQLLPAEATVLSLAILTVSGAVVYSAIMSLFYPELSKSVLQKMRTFRNA